MPTRQDGVENRDKVCSTRLIRTLSMAPSMSVLTGFDCIENEIQSNPVNTDIEGSVESVRINGVCVLSGLNLEKM